jgi:DNA polymerase III epsilon subunit-like protein
MAWNLYDEDGTLERHENFIIRPDGYVIPEVAANIHGITTEHATEHGVPIQDVFTALAEYLPHVSTIVAHNIRFDNSVLLSELHRYRAYDIAEAWQKKKSVCTMLMGTRQNEKWPKLIELYKRLFGREPAEDMHRADADVRACAECYFHMISSK